MKRVVTVALVLLLGLGLAACVAGSAESARAASGGAISQLALGFWHGLIAPVMLIVEVVNKFWRHLRRRLLFRPDGQPGAGALSPTATRLNLD